MAVIQRRKFDGIAREEAVWWSLRREATRGEAVCRMVTHPAGHELRLDLGIVAKGKEVSPMRAS